MSSPKEKLALILKRLSAGLYEKDEALRLSLLAGLAGENVFLLGPPGTAKSLICRRLKYAFENASSFEYLLNQFSTPDEIFGPLSIQKLKDEGKYERLTEGFLPCADIVFLDEIWKAGSAISNSLLTAINEKIFKNGTTHQKLPLTLLVSASNEAPDKDAGLDALWDRFLIRIPVANIQNNDIFKKMIDAPRDDSKEINLPEKITKTEIQYWQKCANSIRLNNYIFNFLIRLKENISKRNNETAGTKKPLYISDRRWRKITRLIKTAAFLNGKKEPSLAECFLAERCLWGNSEEIAETEALVRQTMLEDGLIARNDLQNIRRELYALKQETAAALSRISDERKTVLRTINNCCFFYDASNGERCFIHTSDYNGLSLREKNITLYKQMPGKTGYLNRARHQLYKNGFSAFTHNEDDIEFFLVPKCTVTAKKANADAPFFSLIVDGIAVLLETYIEGAQYRITRRPTGQELAQWDAKTKAQEEFVQLLETDVRSYIKNFANAEHDNLWIAREKSGIITTHITNAKNEIGKIKLEILEMCAYYRAVTDEKVPIYQ
ncbi:MAG: AAA family ATPase [Spirochaetaceae bacterium]|jgi:MoxR-like ATPase|nr:AAA family ATPase [Spirochaetaceae bacterium]